jgi:hypothetical protein
MKIIELTSNNNGSKIYVNVQYIGHFYKVEAKMDYGRVKDKAHTRLGVLTHNNGGFEVTETPDEIMKMILN